ncbi:MAG: hypothetical protein SNJ67_10825 [Chloracidobacterium sp.]|uniref:Uncharacterized protein n=1 Tax=Chloracidobacterium validum TaxID=2821543 RepID=A0ABX8B9V2_9BACT|nr:hypothetical protein [Chloracidobacterium validum]QUW02444.1 hypothetical protein J8C06_08785 [Chloracidobacterium validum]
MTPEQFDTINRLFQLTYQIGDRLGAESSDPAQLWLTDHPDLGSCQALFPAEYTLETLDDERWQEYLADAPALTDLTRELGACALHRGLYRQDEVSWWIVAFWEARARLGMNVLFRAHRVET